MLNCIADFVDRIHETGRTEERAQRQIQGEVSSHPADVEQTSQVGYFDLKSHLL